MGTMDDVPSPPPLPHPRELRCALGCMAMHSMYTLPESIVSVFISIIITFIFKKEQQQQ